MRGSILVLFVGILVFACQRNYTPKPHSFFRIDFPEKEYRLFDSICPFVFEYPVYGKIVPPYLRVSSDNCLFDIAFPRYKAHIHVTYLEINNNFDIFIEDNWRMIFSRLSQRADAIDEYQVYDPDANVFGLIYNISGNAASHVQFFLTDSVKHFVRGSLYFYNRPNYDSLAPAIEFFREDIIHMAETFSWKTNTK